ncbi:hypothetical protein RJ639_005659 [Escallonia herrerae]|uniref:Uncharacterized protein n=1 Tax=Escallonia herrerae TaxID=1293975 RepID=A0AA88VUH8_9ASTE|nr:hypothetical protein RJ639_005659 [Escallonia herrerae]
MDIHTLLNDLISNISSLPLNHTPIKERLIHMQQDLQQQHDVVLHAHRHQTYLTTSILIEQNRYLAHRFLIRCKVSTSLFQTSFHLVMKEPKAKNGWISMGLGQVAFSTRTTLNVLTRRSSNVHAKTPQTSRHEEIERSIDEAQELTPLEKLEQMHKHV